MDPEVKQEAAPDYMIEAEKIRQDAEQARVDINSEEAGTLATFSSNQSTQQWQQIGERISAFLAELPEYLSEFFSEYKRPLITIGLLLSGIVTVKLTLAILGAVNDIPLLAPTFELIGLGYSAWFVYRYLLRAVNRKELAEDFDVLKEQVLGSSAAGK